MTASSTDSPRYASASAFSFCRIIALISGGTYSLSSALTRTSPFGPLTTLYGTIFISSETSSNLRPMKRLIENTVFCGFVTCWRFAGAPTRRCPSFANATTDGVVRPPSAFGMTVGSPPSRTAMHEFVVPRSMPIVFAMRGSSKRCMSPHRIKSKPAHVKSLRLLIWARLRGVEPLVDSWGRAIESLRVSVTDKCNFRCTYCMPAEGLEWLPKQEVLTFEEIERLVRVLARLGVREVRLTGGEPLVRRDLPELVRMLAAVPGVDDLSLTTNGVLLDRLAGPLVAAGLERINVSLDSLSHVRFTELTRRDALDKVLRGLEEAERYPELRPIKVNCVALKGFTEDEVPALAELARRKPYVVRFIEFMPLDADEVWREDRDLTGGAIRALIEERWPLVEIPAAPSSTARRFRFADGAGEVGFVNPVSEPFCSTCDRIRVTADGQLRTCLFSRREWDLKTVLRSGEPDDAVAEAVRRAVRHKELKHRISDPGFVRASRSMSQIGG